jgi:hypothetical protein
MRFVNCSDADGDGYYAPANCGTAFDCNDGNASLHPGATETCNSVDDNCNGSIDEGVKSTFFRDADGDGYGNPSITTQACTVPAGYVATNTDCNDSNSGIHPGATETCNSFDDNCNGIVDDLTASSDPTVGIACQGSPDGACADQEIDIDFAADHTDDAQTVGALAHDLTQERHRRALHIGAHHQARAALHLGGGLFQGLQLVVHRVLRSPELQQ